ncbi:MAG: hypothetical protein ACUVTO_09075 [Candidatus Caldatribacteriaceae bacterium]
MKPSREIWVLLLVALAVRMAFAMVVYGFPLDMACFAGWARQARDVGLSRMYFSDVYVDYPPGYLYVLALLEYLKSFLGIADGSPLFLLLKLPAILADLALAFLFFFVGKERLGEGRALAVAAFFALNPAIILDSALWGQVDSIFVFPLFVGVLLLIEGKPELSSLFFALSILVKPQALVFTPLWLFTFFERKSLTIFLRSLLVGIGTLLVLSLPFSLPAVFRIYRGALGTYKYATLNAFNFFALLGGNWVPDAQKVLFLSFREWGYVAVVGIVIFSAFLFFQGDRKKRFPAVALFLAFSVFLFVHRMHERYLFPALVFALLLYVFHPRREILGIFLGLSGTFFVNVGLILLYSFFGKYHFPRFDWRLIATSAANLGLWVFFLWYTFREKYYRKEVLE